MKILTMMITIFFILSGLAFAESNIRTDIPISITVNDNYIKMDSKPFIYRGSTYVPIRFVSEALGADQVNWHSQSNTAVIQYDGNTIELPVGKNHGYVNGKYTAIENGVMLMEARTFVPVRFVSETMGANVVWEQDYYNVNIQKADALVPAYLIEYKAYTREDIYWLSRVISAESASEPMEGKIAVGNVVLNRVQSHEYPNTIYNVVFDRKFGVQFEPIINGTIYNKPTQDSIIAALRCLEGENLVGSSLFFFNPKIASSDWIARTRLYSTTIGNHQFYL